MLISNTSARRAAAATSALALAAGGAFLASPANAVESAPIDYTCQTALGAKTFSVVHSAPDTVEYASSVPVVTKITVPDDVRGALRGILKVESVTGTVTNYAKALGAPITVDQTIPETKVPDPGPFVLTATGAVDLEPFAAFTPAGTDIPVSVYDHKADDGTTEADDATVVLNYTYQQGQSGPESSSISCEIADNAEHAVGTVKVVKATTATTAKLAKKGSKLVASALVDTPNSSASPANGDMVKFVLKRNGNTVGKPKTVELTDGKATTTYAAKKGKYKLVATYLGADNFASSKDSAAKTVR